MSKTTKSTARSYVNPTGSVNISGGPSATYQKGTTNYNLNSNQQKAFDYAQKAFADGLSSINVFSEDTQKQLNNQVDAYTQNALKELNTLYAPMLQNVREDSARRFGNLDNSVFLDNLNSVENNRANALSSLAQNIVAKQNELINDELQNRYNYLNFMNAYQNQVMNNALNFSNLANNTANLNGQYLTQNAKNQSSGVNDILAAAATIAKFLI